MNRTLFTTTTDMRTWLLSLGVGLVLSLVPARAAELTKAQLAFFESKIRPVLSGSCYKCHSAESENIKGGLRLDNREALLKGGNTGPAIVAGDADKSLLIHAIQYTDPDLRMPPKGQKLPDAQIADLVAWVKMGAPDPRTAPAVTATKSFSESARKHWAFQPVKPQPVPAVKDKSWGTNPVDAFVLAKLEGSDMKPSAAADKRTLLRRATFDLTGLPPTPDEVEAFLRDTSPTAFAKVVERLLDSPHYGERWGRHWLDSARYSDTKGNIKAKYEDQYFAHAWTYRDYVIRSFNEDKPYDRFITEQIAADKLPLVEDRRALAALGFLTLGDRFMNNANDIIDDRIDVVSKSFLGLTVSCARCHDHKFDPIPTADYYSLHGIFSSTIEPKEMPVIVPPEPTADLADYLAKRAALQDKVTAVEASAKDRTKPAEGSNAQLAKARKQLQAEIANLNEALNRLDMNHAGAPVRAVALADARRPADSAIFIRGEAQSKGAIVPRRFLEVLSTGERTPFRNGSGRLELAQSIASRDNPLTARVMINRIWQHHFGEGFVPTPDDLGNQSDPPSHPELLDYLATRFMESGWSIKQMHRIIMLSNTYQQSSENNPQYAKVDPNNRLLWRVSVRRLEFEALRDSILAIGGTLDRTLFGRPIRLDTEPYATRRSIYGLVNRANLAEVLNHFDFANPDVTNGRRNETTVPQQTLFLMNSPLVVEQAKKLVNLASFKALATETERVHFLYERVYQRPPTSEEVQLSLRFLSGRPEMVVPPAPPVMASTARNARKTGKKYADGGSRPTYVQRAPLAAWEEFAHAMFMANEVSYVN